MNEAQTAAIPYENQADPHGGRLCGAASLSMVYRSLGVPATQQEIWTKIARQHAHGSAVGSTYLMAQDALNRGLAAVAVQARNPVQALRRCQEAGIHAILNHRLKEDVSTGHYTVLVEVGKQDVVLHDPLYGPSRHVPQADLLDLWRPRYVNAEIVGNVLVGIAPRQEESVTCPACQSPIPQSIPCPGCGQPVPLQPAALLGCMSPGCPARLWDGICCPFCDHVRRAGTELEPTPPGVAPSDESATIDRAFAELDKFVQLLLSEPSFAARPDLQEQVNFLKGGKARFQEALAERDLHMKQRQTRLEQLQKECQEHRAAQERAQAERNQPAPTPDGNALGLALVKKAGLISAEPKPPPVPTPAPAPVKKLPPKITEADVVRKALQKLKKPVKPEDFDSLKAE
jgi:hypothetical protein